MALKILTLNIHGYQEENQLEKFDIIADNIAANNMTLLHCKKYHKQKKMSQFLYVKMIQHKR